MELQCGVSPLQQAAYWYSLTDFEQQPSQNTKESHEPKML